MPYHSIKHSYLLEQLKTRTDFESCWQWPFPLSRKGYGDYQLKGKTVRAHRESYRRFYGTDPGHLMVLHQCDNPSCFNPAHLFLGTNQDNMDDMNRKGRGNAGKARPKNGRHFVVVSEDKVRLIRFLYQNGTPLAEIHRQLPDINYPNIWNIAKLKSWKHVA